MRRNDSWMSSTSTKSYSRGRRSSTSLAGFGRVFVIVAVLLVLVSIFQLIRPVPLPSAQPGVTTSVIPGVRPTLPWPTSGGGEVEIQNIGTIATFNPDTEIQLASVAKLITALVIVKDHPLAVGSTGPTVTFNAADVARYRQMFAQQDSVMAVAAGEQLNEYQLLEALLLPSADNIAIKLAEWDSGSTAAFVAKMNAYAKSLGMKRTVLKDPSGLDLGTVGSAHDQVLAALAFLKNPLLAQIVAKPQATLPVAGTVFNVNSNVTHDGFVGVKTGSMGNGGNLVFAATGVKGSKDLIIGAILGQQGAQPLPAALLAGRKLVDAARKIPSEHTVLQRGQTVAHISAPGGQNAAVVATNGVTLIGWPGLTIHYLMKFSKFSKSIPAGSQVGSLIVSIGSQSQTVPLVTSRAIKSPSLSWRLERL